MNDKGAKQIIAVTVWGHRVSPVFDSARTLLIASIDGNSVTATSSIAFDPERPLELLHLLRAQQVMVIICGAISETPAAMIEAAGVQLIPFITGDVQQVLSHYLQGLPLGGQSGQFCMPGCGKNICCRGKIHRGRGMGPMNPRRGWRMSENNPDMITVQDSDQQTHKQEP